MSRSTQLTALLIVAGGLAVATAPAPAVAGQDCHASPSFQSQPALPSPEEIAAQKLHDQERREAKARKKAERAARAAREDNDSVGGGGGSGNSPASCHGQP